MKRTVFIVLGVMAIGGVANAASDTYQCWKAKDLKTPQFTQTTVSVADAFSASTSTDLKKPFLLCATSSINGATNSNPNGRLSCYKAKGAKLAAAQAAVVTDQFGNPNIKVSFQKVFVECVPAVSLP